MDNPLAMPLRPRDLPLGSPSEGTDEPRLYCPVCLFNWSGRRETWMHADPDMQFICMMPEHAPKIFEMQLTTLGTLSELIRVRGRLEDEAEFGYLPGPISRLEIELRSATEQVVSDMVLDLHGDLAHKAEGAVAYRRLRYVLRRLNEEKKR